ncbi:hypothetical protein Nocox_33105 [Nonomuraea coxensis DSM 45129]|uniref:Arsenate reductase n=1 Tax=Nonomuraea coxensis DSM 45129 TaxID=1122611 RepID=A0ABX8UB49_9ACTN|nr:hypothetical protein [Nonomuraea coxensis]QYC44191.1 hypothetical protein Nocox_33105 [Nonomuraea coxensis DSM 45129]
MTENLAPGQVWAPSACTLPTAERPLRVAEFDALFAETVRAVRRPGRERLRLELDFTPAGAARAAELAARENGCCSFFTFVLTVAGGALTLEVTVPPEHADVLDALAARAGAAPPGETSPGRAGSPA